MYWIFWGLILLFFLQHIKISPLTCLLFPFLLPFPLLENKMRQRPTWGSFDHVKCSFHHSSTSFPPTNGDRGVQQRIDYPFSMKGKPRRAVRSHERRPAEWRDHTSTKEMSLDAAFLWNQYAHAAGARLPLWMRDAVSLLFRSISGYGQTR